MQNSVITIRTLECDKCGRFDTAMLSQEEIKSRCNSNDMNIGAYTIVHKDHTRIIYFTEEGVFLGDTIALNPEDIPETIQTQQLPIYILNNYKNGFFNKLRKYVYSKIHNRNLTITIAGPSRAGKTSLVRYLQTLIPERENIGSPSVPTMGKSTKHIKIGNSSITTLDLGGQEDFWDLWEKPIKESNAIIFLLDATSSNLIDIAKTFEKVINFRKLLIPILVILNKKDLVLRGETNIFHTSGEFLSLCGVNLPLENVVSIEASVFEGIAYSSNNYEESPLAQIISSFLSDYC